MSQSLLHQTSLPTYRGHPGYNPDLLLLDLARLRKDPGYRAMLGELKVGTSRLRQAGGGAARLINLDTMDTCVQPHLNHAVMFGWAEGLAQLKCLGRRPRQPFCRKNWLGRMSSQLFQYIKPFLNIQLALSKLLPNSRFKQNLEGSIFAWLSLSLFVGTLRLSRQEQTCLSPDQTLLDEARPVQTRPDLLDTMVDFPATMIDLPDTMVDLPDAMVGLSDTTVDLPDMVDCPVTRVDLPDTMVDLLDHGTPPDTMVDLPDTMVDLPDTMVDLSETLVDLPNTTVDLTPA